MQSPPMAEEVTTVPDEPGAPIPKDAIDPALVKLSRPRPKIGVVTALGVTFLCGYFALKLNSDRRFAGEPEAPRRVTVADIATGKVGADAHVQVDAEILMAHAIRVATQKGNIGMRVVPARASAEKLWLVLPGDGWSEPSTGGYVGRLRPLADLPIADSISSFLAANPRPMFAPAHAVRTGFANNRVVAVTGDTIAVRDSDKVAFDIVDIGAASVICSFNERHKDSAACKQALTDAGVTVGAARDGKEQTHFAVTEKEGEAVAVVRTKLEAAKLWGMTVEPVVEHLETTWGKLKTSPPTGFVADTRTIADASIDLMGIYVSRSIPSGSYALIGGERPQDYWYVLPVTILVALIGLLFLWALVRAVKRDVLSPRPAA